MKIVDVRKIWDQAPHNAFTDLVHFGRCFFCVFREGEGHVHLDSEGALLRRDLENAIRRRASHHDAHVVLAQRSAQRQLDRRRD